MSKRRIAVAIAGMLLGAPIGIAGVIGLAPGQDSPAEAALEAQSPETAAMETSDAQAASPAESAIDEAASASGYVIPARPRTLADASFPPLTSDAFPPSTDERPLNPEVIAYLDQRAANTLLADAGAAEPIFAAYDAEEYRISPVQVAYFDQREAMQIAAAEQREREANTPVATATLEAPAGAASSPAVDRVAENMRQ